MIDKIIMRCHIKIYGIPANDINRVKTWLKITYDRDQSKMIEKYLK